ncbi:hypothetical protein [Bowmanella yangjiangensis]|uniref:Uncharacterized protein n=1 Tax=Bowmanella yangjiangensis TaxID=2811230 RepID=A0ABS3CYM1_9ALTE|nr:hypothetical protein [Bowmanella yangjiangensis]MBN7822223.1 hypothetical protein [Bowmanella yangjiangensis]
MTTALFRLQAMRGKPKAKPLSAELPSEAVKPYRHKCGKPRKKPDRCAGRKTDFLDAIRKSGIKGSQPNEEIPMKPNSVEDLIRNHSKARVIKAAPADPKASNAWPSARNDRRRRRRCHGAQVREVVTAGLGNRAITNARLGFASVINGRAT